MFLIVVTCFDFRSNHFGKWQIISLAAGHLSIPDRQTRLHHKDHLPVRAGHGLATPVQNRICQQPFTATLRKVQRAYLHFSCVPADSTAHIAVRFCENFQCSPPWMTLLQISPQRCAFRSKNPYTAEAVSTYHPRPPLLRTMRPTNCSDENYPLYEFQF